MASAVQKEQQYEDRLSVCEEVEGGAYVSVSFNEGFNEIHLQHINRDDDGVLVFLPFETFQQEFRDWIEKLKSHPDAK